MCLVSLMCSDELVLVGLGVVLCWSTLSGLLGGQHTNGFDEFRCGFGTALVSQDALIGVCVASGSWAPPCGL